MTQYVTNVTSFGDTIKILKNKGILSEADIKYKDGKDMYAHFKEIDNLNGQEVLIGIDYEMVKNQDLSKEDATKIVIKNLKKNQFYYTSEDMSGKEGYEMEYIGGKSANADARHMKPVEKDNLVDKAMGMKPVKGFEKAKASSNKAKKETNKGENVEIMSLIAKTVRGLVKMDATGEKVKKIIVKEGTDLNEGPLGTQLLRKADAALKAGQTVTVLGAPIMKIVVPAGALFPADGGPSFRLNNLENPLEDILVDGNEIELDLPAPQAPYVDTRTPDQIAKDDKYWADNFGPGGGKLDEADTDALTQAQQYVASNPTLKSADIKLQKSGDDVILSYNSYSKLTPELAAALEKQFDFEEDQVDGGGEDKDKIYYALSPKHTTPEVGVGLQSMEEMIRKIVREMFDGMEPMDRTGLDESSPQSAAEIEKQINNGQINPAVVKAAAEKAMNGDSTDLALLMFGK
jgi:hypothetical protein